MAEETPLSTFELGADSATKKIVENTVVGLVNSFAGLANTEIKKIKTRYKSGFSKYTQKNIERCSQIKTLLNRNTPSYIYDYYVESRFSVARKTINEKLFLSYFKKNNRICITGIAGSGKSMFMKNLFLKLIQDGAKTLPIFIELRYINNLPSKKDSLFYLILQNIRASISNFDEPQLTYGLRSGLFTLILDGYDEISSEHRNAISVEINNFSETFTDSPIVLSSRPDDLVVAWDRFHHLRILALNTDQAIKLIKKSEYSTG